MYSMEELMPSRVLSFEKQFIHLLSGEQAHIMYSMEELMPFVGTSVPSPSIHSVTDTQKDDKKLGLVNDDSTAALHGANSDTMVSFAGGRELNVGRPLDHLNDNKSHLLSSTFNHEEISMTISLVGQLQLLSSTVTMLAVQTPSLTAMINFGIALMAKKGMSEKLWDEKVDTFKKWGWSDEVVSHAFRSHPGVMLVSIDKINLVMSFWVNQLGWNSLAITKKPLV
ncbi:unnamed protein product [Trifolium pratense]|uniref:Uncharacterized protein n=1 Tax=Trifolium pratense TaxID=57577 RepID=A0ACB0KIV1_TRIPR|nr:unnamed protein product [Trifolium pratense]